MPRMARKKSSTKVYHIILRGNAKQDIFFDTKDYEKFLKELITTKEKYQYELYAYCLMPNHVHLIIYDKNEQLSKILQSLTVTYSFYFNKKYERVGHLFQNRFLSKNIENKDYFIYLCRYIHQNPSNAGIEKMQEYKWSSYQEYIRESKIIDLQPLLTLFDNEMGEAVKKFQEFHKINPKTKLNDFVEYEMIEKLNDEQARKYIMEILEIDNMQELNDYSIKKRNEKIRKLKNVKGISNLQIGRITGLSKKMIEVAMK